MAFPDLGPSIIGAIGGKTKQTPVRKSDALQTQIDLTAGGLPDYRAAQNKSLADYASELQGIGGDVKRLSNEDVGTLGNLINYNANYSPEQGFKNLGDYLTGLWGNAAGKIADIGRGRVNLANASVYGGKGGGSYGENILLNNISQNLAPAWASTVAGITPAFQSVNAADQNRLGNVVNLINTRAQVPFRTADLALMPARARSQFLNDEIGALTGLGGAVSQNLAGFRSDDNTIKRITDAMNDYQNQGMDLATKAAAAYFGGGMGGMGGLAGMAGGGGGGYSPQYWQGPTPAGATPYWQMPYNPNPGRQILPYYQNPWSNQYYNPFQQYQPYNPSPWTTYQTPVSQPQTYLPGETPFV